LGSNGAAKFLDGMKYTPDNSAADALPAAASANRAVFFRNGVPQSFAEVYQSLTNRLDAGQPPSQASIALASAALSQNSGLQPLTLSAQNKIALASATQTKQLATSLGTVKTVLATDPSSTGGVNFLSQIKAAVSNTGTATPSTQYPATLNSWQRAKPIGNTTASSLPISPETASGTAPPLPVDALAKFLDTASQWLPDAGALNEQAQKGVISRAATDGTRA
jgi:hypothetical protein